MAYFERALIDELENRAECLYEATDWGLYYVKAGSVCVDRPSHVHRQPIFEFVNTSCARLVTPGSSLVVDRGHYAIIDQAQPHCHVYCQQARSLQVYLSQSQLAELTNEFKLGLQEVVQPASLRLIGLLKEMVSEAVLQREGYRLMLQTLSLQFLVELWRLQSSPLLVHLNPPRPKLSPEIKRILDYIHAHFTTEISLDDLAVMASLSRYHFLRLFKHQTGLTPHAYLRQIRLERSLVLLRTTTLPIGEIAGQLGFANPGHFSQAFQQRYGLSPSSIRHHS
jgi:AraC-like DNA-binding protein